MSFYSIRERPHDFEIPFTSLVQANAAYGRLVKLTSLMPQITETNDVNAITAAGELAANNAHHVQHMADQAEELATRPDAPEICRNVPVLTNTVKALAKAELRKFQSLTPEPGQVVPHRQVTQDAAAALRSATDGAAVEQTLALVRNYPEEFALCAAAVRLGQRIRNDNSLRNQENVSKNQDAYRGPARETLSRMARQGSSTCKALEAAMVESHSRNLRFTPSPEIERVRAMAEYARRMPTTPTQYYQGPFNDGETVAHIVVFEYWGAKYAKAIWEPYPPPFPAQLAIEHMNAAVLSTAISEPEDGYDGSTAAAMAAAAVMELHNMPAQRLARLMETAGAEAPNTLLFLAAGNRQVAELLARQAGDRNMEFPPNVPQPGTPRYRRMAAAVEAAMGTMAAMRAKARMGHTGGKQP